MSKIPRLFLSIVLIIVLLSSFATAVRFFALTSTAFTSGGPIPSRYTHNIAGCPGGENSNPPLKISSPPNDVGSYVIIMDDIDVPTVHWVVWNIPAETVTIPENWNPAEVGASQGVTDMTTPGMEMMESRYAGPCPPAGENHRYIFHLYALRETFIEDGLPTAVGGDANNVVTVAEFEAARLRADSPFNVLGDTILGGFYPGVSVCGNSFREAGETCANCPADVACAAGERCNEETGMCIAGPRCGNGRVEGTEECEEDNLNGNSCTTISGGFTGGRLRCNIATCRFNTEDCVTEIIPGSVIQGGACTADAQCIEGLSCVLTKCRDQRQFLDAIKGIIDNESLSKRQMIVRIATTLRNFLR